MENLLKILPLAVVMVAGPQIITAIMLATSQQARRSSSAYVAGATLAVAFATTVFYYLADALDLKGTRGDGGSSWFDWVLIAVLLLAAVRVFMKRHESEPPKYMRKLQTETPSGAFRLGLLLFLLMPTDLIMTFTVGTYLASHGAPLWRAAGFLLLTVLLAGAPLLVLLSLGKRAETVLPAARNWMNQNSWVVSELVIALFVVLQLQSVLAN